MNTRTFAAAMAAALLAVICWSGCTVTKSNYKMLSRFFDGVPDPNAEGIAGVSSGPAAAVLSVHPPFAQERCEECHNTGVRLSRESSTLCLKCHEKIVSSHPRMHGPVAAVACLWCHSPHDSTYLHLMRDSDRKVCTQCHTPALLGSARVPEHADDARACQECHFGHGGTERYQLRPGVSAATAAPAEK